MAQWTLDAAVILFKFEEINGFYKVILAHHVIGFFTFCGAIFNGYA